jgi:hypothetical protein
VLQVKSGAIKVDTDESGKVHVESAQPAVAANTTRRIADNEPTAAFAASAPRHKPSGAEAMLMSFADSRGNSGAGDAPAPAAPAARADTKEKIKVDGKPVEVVVKHEPATQSSELVETADGKQVRRGASA